MVELKQEWRHGSKIILKPGIHEKLFPHWCEICHTKFVSYSAKSKYCSHKCRAVGQTAKATHAEYVCSHCFSPMKILNHHIREKIGNFCSKECWQTYLKTNGRKPCPSCKHMISDNLFKWHIDSGKCQKHHEVFADERLKARMQNFLPYWGYEWSPDEIWAMKQENFCGFDLDNGEPIFSNN